MEHLLSVCYKHDSSHRRIWDRKMLKNVTLCSRTRKL